MRPGQNQECHHDGGPMKSIHCITVPAIMLAVAAACDGTTTETRNDCDTVPLPVSGSAAAPEVVAVGLEVQPSGIVAVATATDPQGTANLLDVIQSVGVFPDPACLGMPIVIQDDLAGSGVEETFGTVVDAVISPTLYNAIAASSAWPVAVDFRDRDDNRTTARVMAAVMK